MAETEIDMDAPMGATPTVAGAPDFEDEPGSIAAAKVDLQAAADEAAAKVAALEAEVKTAPESEKPKRGRKPQGESTEVESALTVTIGRMVHYYTDPAAAQRAAIVVQTYSDGLDTVSLCVLNLKGLHVLEEVPFSPEPQPGHWSWPTRS